MKVLYNGEYIELNDSDEEKELDKITDDDIDFLNNGKNNLENTVDYTQKFGDINE